MADLILLLLLARIHWLISILSIIVSAIVGAWLLRRQGTAVATRLRSNLAGGQIPTEPIMDGAMIFLAAGLLLTPGLITDLIGISMLIPVCRGWYITRIKEWFRIKVEAKAEQLKAGFQQSYDLEGGFRPADMDHSESVIIESLQLDERPDPDELNLHSDKASP